MLLKIRFATVICGDKAISGMNGADTGTRSTPYFSTSSISVVSRVRTSRKGAVSLRSASFSYLRATSMSDM